jgi:hypothetical protein
VVEERDAVHVPFESGEVAGGRALCDSLDSAERGDKVIASRAEDELVVDATEYGRLGVIERPAGASAVDPKRVWG